MNDSTEKQICNGCGKEERVSTFAGNLFCDDCRKLAELFQKDPDRIATIMQLTHFNSQFNTINSPHALQNDESFVPAVVNAVRYKTKDNDANTWYVSVSEMEGNPVEIFASTAFDRDHHMQSRISNLTTITRLLSMILRHIFLGEVLTLDKTIKQINRSSRQRNDLPDLITQILQQYPRKPHRK